MEEIICKHGGYIIGTLLFWIGFIIWHMLKGNFEGSKHKKVTPKKYYDDKNK